jgi:hypothetical protein
VKRLFFACSIAAVLLLAAPMLALHAQDAAEPAEFTGPANAVQGFFTACVDSAFIDLNGTLLIGWDVFYQIFAGAAGSGTPLTGVRQVQVGGQFSFSENIRYNEGQTLPAGATASARVWVGRETDPNRIDFEFTLTDVQDGCEGRQVQGTPGTSLDAGSGPAAAQPPAAGRNLLAPDGRILNPNLRPEPAVVVGPRLSDRFRSETPGLIFAECNAFELALPGIVYDSDPITVYWAWFARTEAQIQDHFDNAIYEVTMNGAPFNNVRVSEVTRRNGNFWVFYTADVGNLRPGHYEIAYRLTWANPISDGFEQFGPGTENPVEANRCNFDVQRNPDGLSIVYSGEFFPTRGPVHDITPDE